MMHSVLAGVVGTVVGLPLVYMYADAHYDRQHGDVVDRLGRIERSIQDNHTQAAPQARGSASTRSDAIPHEPLDLFCMAKNIYHEARGEDLVGQYAVAQVTVNRTLSEDYPNTVCHVVMQHGQFSWTENRSIRWTHPTHEPKAWATAQAIARDVMVNGVRVDGLTDNVLYYHADYVNPHWAPSFQRVAQVGTHIFYKE